MADARDYSQWSPEQLQDRVKLLDTKIERLEEQVDNLSGAPARHDDAHESLKFLESYRGRDGDFDPSRYTYRLVSLKLAYLGKNYNGFEDARNDTPLPTVEETLWKALMKGRLISPTPKATISDGEPNFDGCEYSKCGRTDKGVSAFGQVIGIRLRSNRPLKKVPTELGAMSNLSRGDEGEAVTPEDESTGSTAEEQVIGDYFPSSISDSDVDDETTSFHPVDDEIPYCVVINRLLPPDIRILAWCPSVPTDFSARHSCGQRQYTYFFTQPAFTPTTGPISRSRSRSPKGSKHGNRREGYLDIQAMQAAAKKFEGLHDFRNFCKIDGSKQLDSFDRRILHASIAEQNSSDNTSISNIPTSYVSDPAFQELTNSSRNTSPSPNQTRRPSAADATTTARPSPDPKLYAFHLHGTAFLWHQVRHMVAILFLIGQGLEPASVIDDLFDISKYPCRPQYVMAAGAPLVLSNCIYPRDRSAVDYSSADAGKDSLEWVYVGCDPLGDDAGLSSRRKRPVEGNGGRYGVGGVVDELWRVWRERKIEEVLAGRLLDVVARQGIQGGNAEGGVKSGDRYVSATADGERGRKLRHGGGVQEKKSGNRLRGDKTKSSSQIVFQGGDMARHDGRYIPVSRKPRMDSVEVVNQRYRERRNRNGRTVKIRGQSNVALTD